MKKVLPKKFFNRPTITVAKDLLGCVLVRKINNKQIKSVITEVEAYDGFLDRASHAHRGKTKRNAVMFGEAGHWYVYLTYGIHIMLNIVTGPKDFPAAILIRGIDIANGPGRLTKKLKISKSFNTKTTSKNSGLWIENGSKKGLKIKRSARIGVDYAGPVWANKKYRFYINR